MSECKFSIKWIEGMLVVFFIIMFLWNGVGKIGNHRLQHQYPHGLYQADAWVHYTNIQSIIETGSYKYAPSWTSFGLTDVIGMYPPLLYTTSATLSYSTGFEPYDAYFLLVHLFFIFVMLVAYFLIRKYNKMIALLSLPFFMVQFFSFHSVWNMVSGDWAAILGTAYALFFFWSYSYQDLKGFFIISSLFIAAIFLTQASNLYEIAIFSIVYFTATSLNNKRINFDFIKKMAIISLTSLLISSYYLLIFKQTIMYGVWKATNLLQFKYMPLPKEFAVSIFDFDVFIIFFAIGIIILIYLLIKKAYFISIVGTSYLITGFSFLIGNSDAIEMRYLWIAGLALFFGAGVYYSISIFYKNAPTIVYSIITMALLLISLYLITNNLLFERPVFNPGPHLTLMDKPHWDSLMLLRDKTEKDAKIYFFYSDNYFNYYNSVYNAADRFAYNILFESYEDIMKTKSIPSYLDSFFDAQPVEFLLPYKKSFFKVGHYVEENPERYNNKNVKLCDFEYFVLDEETRIPNRGPIIELNKLIKTRLLEKEGLSLFWSNGIVTILKNAKSEKGGWCA